MARTSLFSSSRSSSSLRRRGKSRHVRHAVRQQHTQGIWSVVPFVLLDPSAAARLPVLLLFPNRAIRVRFVEVRVLPGLVELLLASDETRDVQPGLLLHTSSTFGRSRRDPSRQAAVHRHDFDGDGSLVG